MNYGQIVYNYLDHRGQILSTTEKGLSEYEYQYPYKDLKNKNLVLDEQYWNKVGVQGPAGLIFEINGVTFLLGPSGVYEINNYEIKTFKIIDFSTGKNIIIDYGY